MSEHLWTLKRIAAHLAGGLRPAASARLERHVAACPDCRRALDAAQDADRELLGLFECVRPDPLLEERMVQTFRQQRALTKRLPPMWVKVMLATAAAAVMVVTGAGISSLLEEDRLPSPQAAHRLKQIGDGWLQTRKSAASDLRGDHHLEGYSLGTDLVGGTIHTNGAKWAEHVAADIREKSLTIFDSSGSMSVKDGPAFGFESFDADPFVQNGELAGRKVEEASVPGSVDLSPSPGILGSPPVNSPARPHYSPYGGIIAGKSSNGIAVFEDATKKTVNGREGKESPTKPVRMPATDGAYFKPGEVFNPPPSKSESSSKENAPDKRVPPPDQTAGAGQGRKENDEPARAGPGAGGGSAPAGPVGGEKKPEPPSEPLPVGKKYIIRNGEIDFEIESFDAAVAVVQKLVDKARPGYVATVNSDKLANGKMRGSVVVRVPPHLLDELVLGLRRELGKTGELKSQRIGSQDVSKNYTDLESRLKAARTMEERLLRIIKDGKGEIKDLVAAEKELGVWRTRIEEVEGELRYYNNLISLSTLTINLTEKQIRLAAAVSESECIQTGIEVEDVEKAMREVHKAVEEAKGRVTRSELKQNAGGQLNAILDFEVVPDAAGPVRDRLKQLGHVARLEINRVQSAENGQQLPKNGKLERGNTQFKVSLYNLVALQPRESVTLKVAATDVATAYRAVREAIAKANGRIQAADLNEQDRKNVGAQLVFDVRRAEESAVVAALNAAGDVLTRQVNRAAESESVTDAKVQFRVDFVPATAMEPREAVAMGVEVSDVDATISVLTAQVKEMKGRVVKGPDLAHELNGRVTALIVYDVPLINAAAFSEKIRNSGNVRTSRTIPNPQAPEGPLATARFQVTLSNAELLVPRDEGLWAQIRNGLSISLRGLSVSVGWLIVCVLFVLPWLLLLVAAWWLSRRIWRPAVMHTAPAAPVTPPVAG